MLRNNKRTGQRALAVLGAATAFVLLTAGVSAAQEPIRGDAQAVELQLLGQPLVSSGGVTAENDGTQDPPGTVTGNPTPGLEILGSQNLITAGVLVQDATTGPRGSAACAGLVGEGGLIQIGESGSCTATIGEPGGVTINPGTGLPLIRADAIYAECTATSSDDPDNPGEATGFATLLNAFVGDTQLAVNPGPNTVVDLGLVRLILNEQTSAGPGQITVTALHLIVLPQIGDNPLVDLKIGTVSCLAPPVISAFPVEGLPIALAGFATAGGIAWLALRHRRRAGTVAVG